MSKITELAIKKAYENRANAVIAMKQAAGPSRLEQAVNYIKSHPNLMNGLKAGGYGSIAGVLTSGVTKALGGTNRQAIRNGLIGGGLVSAGSLAKDYRNEISAGAKSGWEKTKGGAKSIGDALRGLVTKKAPAGKAPAAAPTAAPATPKAPAKKVETKAEENPQLAITPEEAAQNINLVREQDREAEARRTGEETARQGGFMPPHDATTTAPSDPGVPNDQKNGGFTRDWVKGQAKNQAPNGSANYPVYNRP